MKRRIIRLSSLLWNETSPRRTLRAAFPLPYASPFGAFSFSYFNCARISNWSRRWATMGIFRVSNENGHCQSTVFIQIRHVIIWKSIEALALVCYRELFAILFGRRVKSECFHGHEISIEIDFFLVLPCNREFGIISFGATIFTGRMESI